MSSLTTFIPAIDGMFNSIQGIIREWEQSQGTTCALDHADVQQQILDWLQEDAEIQALLETEQAREERAERYQNDF